jgi:hypothetical protein
MAAGTKAPAAPAWTSTEPKPYEMPKLGDGTPYRPGIRVWDMDRGEGVIAWLRFEPTGEVLAVMTWDDGIGGGPVPLGDLMEAL